MDIQLLSSSPALAVTGTGVPGVAPQGAETTELKIPASSQEEPVADVADSLNSAARLNSTALEFSVDEATQSQVVIVRDVESGEVIMQYPSEDALRMIRNLEAGVGGLVDKLI
ncbi:MAG: flagellar protein FlaG [Proteobacteria bacterium]|nr:flagellar protein FlaG [Pseudomonadota bacterium]